MKRIAEVIELGSNHRVATIFSTIVNNDRVMVIRCFCQGGLANMLSMNTKLVVEEEITATDLVLLHGTASLKTITTVIEEEIKQSRRDCCVGTIGDDEVKSKQEIWQLIEVGDTIKCTDERGLVSFEIVESKTPLFIRMKYNASGEVVIDRNLFFTGDSWCKEISIAKFHGR